MRWTSVLLTVAALVAPAAPVRAQADVLQVIPDDAIGFALINRVGQTNDKTAALARRLKIDIPGSPLEMIKGALGVDKGLLEKGSVAIAAFAGKGESDEPSPLIFVPVTDYQAFIGQLKPDEPTAAITAIKIKGKDMFAGKRGNFAILAGSEDRALLERALKAKKNLATWAEPMSSWLTENDVVGVLTGDGVKLLGAQARKGIEVAKQNLGGLPPEAQVVGKFFDAAESCIKSIETDVVFTGLGARLDQGGSLHITSRTQFLKSSGFAKAGASVKAPPDGPLAGLPSGPFVLALGGTLPQDSMQGLMSMNLEMIKAGGQNIPAETLKKLEDAYAQMMKGVSGMALVWQVGKDNQPIFANIAATMHIDNAAKYMVAYEKSIGVLNEVFKEINLPFMPTYDVKKVKVGGKDALELSADFAGGMGLPEEAQKIFKSMFGPDGKMKISIAARDDKTIVMRYTAAEGLKDLLNGPVRGLSSDADVAQVIKSLPPGAQWAFYLSPKGLTEFADRMVKDFSPIPLAIPKFPATPPVAVAARISGQGFEVHVVVPAEVLDNAGGFVEELKRLFRGGV